MVPDDCPPQEYPGEEWCNLTDEQKYDLYINGKVNMYLSDGQLHYIRVVKQTKTYKNVCSWMESLDDNDRDKIDRVIYSLRNIDISNIDSMEIFCTCKLSNATVTLTGKMTKNVLEISKHTLN